MKYPIEMLNEKANLPLVGAVSFGTIAIAAIVGILLYLFVLKK